MSDTYKYKRYMRNGQTVEKTGVVRSRNGGDSFKQLKRRDPKIDLKIDELMRNNKSLAEA